MKCVTIKCVRDCFVSLQQDIEIRSQTFLLLFDNIIVIRRDELWVKFIYVSLVSLVQSRFMIC
jgi:hypothetical protein